MSTPFAPAGLAPAGASSFRGGQYLSSRRRAFGADDDGVSSSATGQKTAVPDGRSQFEYQLEQNPEFLRRIARARIEIRDGLGVKLEDVARPRGGLTTR
jgi:hypothetical protein